MKILTDLIVMLIVGVMMDSQNHVYRSQYGT